MELYEQRKSTLYNDLEVGLTSHTIDGTDIILAEILRDVNKGFYIDIGANHPIKHSNTYYLYKLGWKGIVIDGNDVFKDIFKEIRPNDQFITALISSTVKEINFKIFPDDTMSSANPEQIAIYEKRFQKSEIISINGKTTTLSNIRKEQFIDTEVHLLSVDIEGEDLNCLIGSNFENWKPGVVVIEIKHLSLHNIKTSDIVNFLTGHGYSLISKTPLNAIFIFPEKDYLSWVPKSLFKK